MCIQSMVLFVKQYRGLLELAFWFLSIIVPIIIAWCVTGFVTKQRIAARCGFYINMFSYLELLDTEMKRNKGKVQQGFIMKDEQYELFFPNSSRPKAEEVEKFSDICQKFRDFLLSSENNIKPRGTVNWSTNQLELVKFLHKGIGIGKIDHFFDVGKDDFKKEIDKIINVIKELKDVTSAEINK